MVRVKPTIYVVEDDPDISRLVRHHLEGASFNVRLYSTGNLVVVDAERQRPALFLLDIMVPGKDGLELCRQIRQSLTLASVPVIFLTAKSGEADRVLGLELGADDYIPKPFSPRELVARVKAVLRRARPAEEEPRVLTFGDLELIPEQGVLRHHDGEDVHCTRTEFRLLCELATNPNKVLTREQLLDEIPHADDRLVDGRHLHGDISEPQYNLLFRGCGGRYGPRRLHAIRPDSRHYASDAGSASQRRGHGKLHLADYVNLVRKHPAGGPADSELHGFPGDVARQPDPTWPPDGISIHGHRTFREHHLLLRGRSDRHRP